VSGPVTTDDEATGRYAGPLQGVQRWVAQPAVTHHGEPALGRREAARAMVLGGTPFPDRPVMGWNDAARTRDEVSDGHRTWVTGAEQRFGPVAAAPSRTVPDPHPWDRG